MLEPQEPHQASRRTRHAAGTRHRRQARVHGPAQPSGSRRARPRPHSSGSRTSSSSAASWTRTSWPSSMREHVALCSRRCSRASAFRFSKRSQQAYRSRVGAATSLPELAGDAAVLFDPNDVDAIADGLEHVWTDDELRATLVDAAGCGPRRTRGIGSVGRAEPSTTRLPRSRSNPAMRASWPPRESRREDHARHPHPERRAIPARGARQRPRTEMGRPRAHRRGRCVDGPHARHPARAAVDPSLHWRRRRPVRRDQPRHRALRRATSSASSTPTTCSPRGPRRGLAARSSTIPMRRWWPAAVKCSARRLRVVRRSYTSTTSVPKLLREQDVIHGSPILNARFFRRGLLERVGKFDTRWGRCADFDLLMRVLDMNPERAVTDQVVYRSRAHSDSLTFRGGIEIELTRGAARALQRTTGRDGRHSHAASALPPLAQLGSCIPGLEVGAGRSLRGRGAQRLGRADESTRCCPSWCRPGPAASPHARPTPMTATSVALIALTTSGAAGDYVSALGCAMARRARVGMWIPGRPPLDVDVETHFIDKPGSRVGVASHEAVAWLRHSALADDVQRWKPDVAHVVFGEGYPTAARAAATLAARGSHRRCDLARPHASWAALRSCATRDRIPDHAARQRGSTSIASSSCPTTCPRTCSSPSSPHSRALRARASRRRNRCAPTARSS